MRSLILGICLTAASIAVAATPLPAVLAALAFSACMLALFAPEPFRWLQPTPRSIFETRRLGLA